MAEIKVFYESLSVDELADSEKALVALAEDAMMKAHAPYSRFTVGSALRLSNGNTYCGNNQENAAYPSGLCAERVTLFKAKSESREPIETLVILAKNEKGELADAFACGSCRQVMMEYANLQEAPIRILMRDKNGKFVAVSDLRALLPFSFEAKTLD